MNLYVDTELKVWKIIDEYQDERLLVSISTNIWREDGKLLLPSNVAVGDDTTVAIATVGVFAVVATGFDALSMLVPPLLPLMLPLMMPLQIIC